MAVVVNNPNQDTESAGWGGMSIFLALVFFAIVIYFLVVYALPSIRQQTPSMPSAPSGGSNIQQNQTAPPANQDNGGSPQINVPDKVNINLQQQQKPTASPSGY